MLPYRGSGFTGDKKQSRHTETENRPRQIARVPSSRIKRGQSRSMSPRYVREICTYFVRRRLLWNPTLREMKIRIFSLVSLQKSLLSFWRFHYSFYLFLYKEKNLIWKSLKKTWLYFAFTNRFVRNTLSMMIWIHDSDRILRSQSYNKLRNSGKW